MKIVTAKNATMIRIFRSIALPLFTREAAPQRGKLRSKYAKA
jgi:hypothetical protein